MKQEQIKPEKAAENALPGEPEERVKVFRVFKGDSTVKKNFKLEIPKDTHWRLLWSFEAASAKEDAVIKLTVTSPTEDRYMQGIVKRIGKQDGQAFSIMNICLTTCGEFDIALDASKGKWRLEAQLLDEAPR